MPITFGKIAYVSNTPASMLDRMGMSVNTVAQNDGLVIVSCDTIKETLKTYDETIGTDNQNISTILAEFLKKTLNEIKGEADEIFFTD